MTSEHIESSIRDFIAQNILFSDKGFPHGDDVSFLSEGIVDSIGVMELVSFVSDRYKLEVDPQDITPDNFDSVRRLAEYIRRRRSPAADLKTSLSAG